MCLILFAYQHHPKYSLIVAANRDEYFSRPSAPAEYWSDHPHVLAGRDLKELGTWMGITIDGNFAALTNYRAPSNQSATALSRGHLVSDFLCDKHSPAQYLESVAQKAKRYNGFNLLVGDGQSLWYYGNRQEKVQQVMPGIHGICNHILNTPWPKLEQGRQQLAQCLTQADVCEDDLWNILSNRQKAADDELPMTGVGLEWERTLSSIFVEGLEYGTRSSTILLVGYDDSVKFVERSYHASLTSWQEVSYEFKIKP
ncbi:NRDE family protein [Pelosinus sp. sgz500959]|uniref:NRDE family protein n=1 Tax=Pelosinus sp. sgz500959 TaxID=3242472 RepID=UPI003671FEE4